MKASLSDNDQDQDNRKRAADVLKSVNGLELTANNSDLDPETPEGSNTTGG